MWNKTHSFTLIDKTELDSAKLSNDAANKSTPEYGIQMTQEGYDADLRNISPSLCNADNTLCMIRGCHVMHAIEYMTLEQAKALSKKWQTEYKIEEVI